MDHRTTARLIAAGRTLFGLLCLLRPRVLTGFDRSEPSAAALGWIRLFGVRDVVLGAGTLASLNGDDGDTRWVKMSAAADTADAVTVVTVRDEVGVSFMAVSLALAVPAAALGWRAAFGLGRSRG